MGRGEIITNYGNGLYKVKIIYGGRDRLTARIAILDDAISALQDRIDAESDDYQKKLLKLEKAALGKSKQYLTDSFPDDYNLNMYCADRTEDLSGNIGTIEIPGEAQQFNIQPGHDGDADYKGSRDGQLWPAIAGSADWCYFNQCILPGWQKDKPTYRHGSIIAGSIDFGNHTCDICIDAAFSSQLNLNVNEGAEIQGCPGDEPYGFTNFCADNPDHPACTNTSQPQPLSVGSSLFSKIKEINLDVNTSHPYKSDASGWRAGEDWKIMDPGEGGDCIACYEEIFVENGIKKVGDLVVGDKVLSYDFENQKYVYKSITKIWEKGLLPGKRVGLKNGQAIDITANHPLWVRYNQTGGRAKYKTSQYKKQYFKDIDFDVWHRRRLPIAVKIPYQIKDIEWLNEDLCFIAGHYIAEGWKEKDGIKISSSGYEIIDKIIPLLEKHNIKFSEYKNNSDVPCIRFLKSEFKEFLKTLKSNSFDIHLPEYFFHLPENKLEKLIDGFYLGDGHDGNYTEAYKYNSNKAEVYSTSSKQWAADIQRIGLQIGKTFHIWKQENHQGAGSKPIYRITYNPESYFLRDHGYHGISEVGIARKEIKDIGMVKMRDFEVADIHTFIFKNGLIAHQCEDFALTKMQELLDYGVDIKHLQIATCAVERGLGWHAVLMVQTQDRGILILDNRFDTVLTKETLEDLGYQWERYQAAGRSWSTFSTKLLTVPIEYMSCNSAAFVDGDEVLIKFTNQAWANPKVIGFKSDPEPCEAVFYWFLGHNWPPAIQTNQNSLNLQTKSYSKGYIFEASISWPAGWIYGDYIYRAGGGQHDWDNGGNFYTTKTQRFYAITGTYQNKADHPNPARAFHSGFMIDGKGYISGGTDEVVLDTHASPLTFSSASNWFNCYDPDTNSWSNKQNIGANRMNHAAGAIGDYGYIWGGVSRYYEDPITEENTVDYLSSTKKYDPASNVWVAKENCNARDYQAFGQGANYLIHYGGYKGMTEDEGYHIPEYDGQYFNVQSETWSTIPDPGNIHNGDPEFDQDKAQSTHRLPAGIWTNKFYILCLMWVGMLEYDLDTLAWSSFWDVPISGISYGGSIPAYSLGGIIV